MKRTAVIFVIVITSAFFQTDGKLIMAPRDTESKVGDTTYVNCSTDLDPLEIFWYHDNRTIVTGSDRRFTTEINASKGFRNLVIQSVEPVDAGEYICADGSGVGERRSAQLIVIDDDPDCQSNMQPDGVIGQNVFNITPDEVQLTCTVTYHGSIPPRMEWMKVGENNSTIKDNVTSNIASGNRVIYTLKLTGDVALDNTSYICQTTRSTQNQYKCYSEPIKVLYFIGDEITELSAIAGDSIACRADSRPTYNSFFCICLWYDKKDVYPTHCGSIAPRTIGEYTCKVKCHIRGSDYKVAVAKADVREKSIFPIFAGFMIMIAAITMIPMKIVRNLAKVAHVPDSVERLVCVGVLERVNYYEDYHSEQVVPWLLLPNVLLAIFTLIASLVQDSRYDPISVEFLYSVILLLVNSLLQVMLVIPFGLFVRKYLPKRSEGDAHVRRSFEETPIDYLLSRKTFATTDDMELSDDKVVEEEVELLFKLKQHSDTSDSLTFTGVAFLEGKLFFARKMTSMLEVYDFSNLPFSAFHIYLPQILSVVDICACAKNKCLYILDKKIYGMPKEVTRVDVETARRGDTQVSWKTRDDEGGFISVTAEGNVIITANVKQLLYEYSCDGDWLRTLTFPGCNNHWHAIKLDSDRFIVCHGTILDSVHRVCLVEDKIIKKSFGRGIGSGANQMNIPYYLAAVSNGWVVVADLCNNRLLLLDSNLELIAKIVPKYKQRFLYPQRVCLDEKLGLLVVIVGSGDPRDIPSEHEDCPSADMVDIDKSTENSILLREVEKEKISENGYPKITIIKEKANSCTEALEDDTPRENIMLLEKTEEGKLKENGYHKKADLEEGGGPIDQTENVVAPKENNNIFPEEENIWTLINAKDSKQIEKNCRVLVFDIKPLLQKFYIC